MSLARIKKSARLARLGSCRGGCGDSPPLPPRRARPSRRVRWNPPSATSQPAPRPGRAPSLAAWGTAERDKMSQGAEAGFFSSRARGRAGIAGDVRAVDPRELASARGHRRSKVTWAYLFAPRMSSVSSPPFGAFPMLPPSLSFQRGPMRGRKRTRQTPSRPRVRRVCQPSAPAKSEERAPYALARHRETARPPVVRVLWRERITQLLFSLQSRGRGCGSFSASRGCPGESRRKVPPSLSGDSRAK